MSILDSFDTFISDAAKHQPLLDYDLKQRHKDVLAKKGLPTRHEEAWRNTSLRFLSDTNYTPATHLPKELPLEVVEYIDSKKIPGCEYIVYLNGFFVPSLSQYNTQWISLAPAKPKLAVVTGGENEEAIQALNEIFNLNAMDIVVLKELLRPLQILNVVHPLGAKAVVAVSPKLNVTLKSNTGAKVVVSSFGQQGAMYFSNSVFNFFSERDSRLELVNHVRQSEKAFHLDSISISAEEKATVRYFELNLKSAWIRHNFKLDLNGENIQAEVLGASKLKGTQHCDSQTYINHHRGSCKSEQVYKGLLADESHSVFCGTVFIAEGIAKTESTQLNQNLLLSEKAEVNSKPVLNIYSDDVKASHGSTMGQIQEDEIFYLQSRCISRLEAVELLGRGFLNEIVFRIESEILKRYFSEELWH